MVAPTSGPSVSEVLPQPVHHALGHEVGCGVGRCPRQAQRRPEIERTDSDSCHRNRGCPFWNPDVYPGFRPIPPSDRSSTYLARVTPTPPTPRRRPPAVDQQPHHDPQLAWPDAASIEANRQLCEWSRPRPGNAVSTPSPSVIRTFMVSAPKPDTDVVRVERRRLQVALPRPRPTGGGGWAGSAGRRALGSPFRCRANFDAPSHVAGGGRSARRRRMRIRCADMPWPGNVWTHVRGPPTRYGGHP